MSVEPQTHGFSEVFSVRWHLWPLLSEDSKKPENKLHLIEAYIEKFWLWSELEVMMAIVYHYYKYTLFIQPIPYLTAFDLFPLPCSNIVPGASTLENSFLYGKAAISNQIRCMTAPPRCIKSPYRTLDGTCNNLQNPIWGAANTR